MVLLIGNQNQTVSTDSPSMRYRAGNLKFRDNSRETPFHLNGVARCSSAPSGVTLQL